MVKPANALLVASSIVLALPITGCAMGGDRSSSFARKIDRADIGVALRAQAALEKGDAATAIRFAEQAVENSPGDAGFRSLLGNAYLAAGRFRSAEAAYGDALALIPGQAGVPLKLALAQAALGKSDAAFATLERYRDSIDPADAGLAMALAGRPGAAVELLDQVARQPGADGRVRQNLALAHALAGDWVRARGIAAQDVPGDQLETRMAEWAALAQPAPAGGQVAALIGVPAGAADQGQPDRLALRSAPREVQLAAQGQPPANLPAPAVAAVASEAEPAAAPSFMPPVAEALPVAEPAIAAAEPAAPEAAPDLAQMVDSIRREPIRASGALPRVAELRRAAARRFGQSQAVVQLGAYATEAGVKMGWSAISRRHRGLAAYVPASARFNGPAGTVYRLSLKGFASDREARQLCMQIKAKGGNCFVRSVAGDSPVRFARR
jgi:Flp pilus assembly protein TadD